MAIHIPSVVKGFADANQIDLANEFLSCIDDFDAMCDQLSKGGISQKGIEICLTSIGLIKDIFSLEAAEEYKEKHFQPLTSCDQMTSRFHFEKEMEEGKEIINQELINKLLGRSSKPDRSLNRISINVPPSLLSVQGGFKIFEHGGRRVYFPDIDDIINVDLISLAGMSMIYPQHSIPEEATSLPPSIISPSSEEMIVSIVNQKSITPVPSSASMNRSVYEEPLSVSVAFYTGYLNAEPELICSAIQLLEPEMTVSSEEPSQSSTHHQFVKPEIPKDALSQDINSPEYSPVSWLEAEGLKLMPGENALISQLENGTVVIFPDLIKHGEDFYPLLKDLNGDLVYKTGEEYKSVKTLNSGLLIMPNNPMINFSIGAPEPVPAFAIP